MRYKVYAGTVDVVFKSNTQARFRWKKKTLVYDSYGDAVEGEETEGILTDPVVDLENKEPGTFTCEVPYKAETRFGTVKNPYYDEIKVGETWMMVEEDGECIFFGRVTETNREFDLSKTITADGILNELSQMQTRLTGGTYQTTDGANHSILTIALKPNQADKGNSPVNCMERGNVTVKSQSIDTTDSGDQFGSFWTILTTYLLEHEKGKDGYLRLRLANDPGTEDYFFYYDYMTDEDMPTTDQAIEYGVNMLDLTLEEKRTSELVNSVTAHGISTVKKGWWIFSRTSYETITATAQNTLSIAAYGLCSRHIYVDGKKSTADSLKKAAQEQLDDYKQVIEPTLTVKAFDRRDTGENVGKLGFLLRTHILSQPHEMDRWMICTKLKLPLDSPDNKQFTFGLTSKKLSKRVDAITSAINNVKNALFGLIGHVNEDDSSN